MKFVNFFIFAIVFIVIIEHTTGRRRKCNNSRNKWQNRRHCNTTIPSDDNSNAEGLTEIDRNAEDAPEPITGENLNNIRTHKFGRRTKCRNTLSDVSNSNNTRQGQLNLEVLEVEVPNEEELENSVGRKRHFHRHRGHRFHKNQKGNKTNGSQHNETEPIEIENEESPSDVGLLELKSDIRSVQRP